MSIQPRARTSLLWLVLLSLLAGGCSLTPRADPARPLFDGQTLNGWQGLVGNPYSRAQMAPEARTAAQSQADQQMRDHWSVEQEILVFDGHGSHLCTIEEFSDFVLEVEWMIEPGGDSGIYLRGSPQVQIWDLAQHPEGSGGLYNNQQGPSRPQVAADHPTGQWNHFRIEMVGPKVTVDLNGQRVVDEVVLENYWNREKPIVYKGPIELQSHGSRLQFRNLSIRTF
ncbi:MAG: DUF1080 domain-containing protein [Planctomycetota bacterium]|nr:DUF1080 domain-containing protein [Planctomycetota bacterium]